MEETSLRQAIDDAAVVLTRFLDQRKPVAGLILGSGLNCYADTLEQAQTLPFGDVPRMGVSTAEGHRGCFVLGKVAKTDTWVLCMQGRLHGYEGYSAAEVAFPVWVMQACGIDILITTNAAGAINPAFKVGTFCLMTDHINATGRNPLVGQEPARMAQRFVPMMDAYDPSLRVRMHEAAQQTQVTLEDGVYLSVLGPSFETPAEIRAFATWGADTVAMSVVEEVIAARHCGMRVVGMSLLSNMACGVEGGDPTSDEVMDVARAVEQDFTALMDAFLQKLSCE